MNGAKRDSQQFLSALGTAIVFPIFVNLIELGCTAILPMVYMTTLANHCTENTGICYSIWTALYAPIYMIPLLGILLSFVYSFQSSRLSENQERMLKSFSVS